MLSSKERDAETGLDYFQTRYFSSAQGRYTSPDSLMASARPSNPQTWNRYAYGLNNPLQGAKDDLGNGNIALNVTYTSGEVTSSGVSGLNSSAANVFLSSYVPTSVIGNAFLAVR